MKPAGFDPEKKYPGILTVHGGPRATFGPTFFHESQVFANAGYFVFFTNPLGSDGRGNEFADITGKHGGIDFDCCMALTDEVVKRYPQIDEKRLGIMGGSYGGFMTNWAIGNTTRFAAACSQRSIANWISKCMTTDIGYYFNMDQLAADPWNSPEKMWAHSPLKYADMAKTPTLFIQSDEDYRCWMVEALQMFSALKVHGIESRVCLFEAAWRKYHANDELDIARTGCTEYSANQLYQLAADAAREVMDNSPYQLYTSGSYANGRGAYRELFIADNAVTTEVMMAIETDKVLGLGEQNWWYNSSTYGPHLCMSRKFAKTYLNIDGSPYNERNADGSYKTFLEETTGRDTRLNQTIRGADYTRLDASGNYVATAANFTGHTLTGYQFTKFVMDDVSYDDAATNDNDIPILRYAEVLLNYAEAKAELGTLTDADWAETIGALRARAGITGGTAQTGTLTTKPTTAEPYIASYYPTISDPVLLEIRREREIELCLEGFRLNDLKRWNCCDLWVNDPWEGIFIPALNTPLDMNGDGTYDVYFYDTDAIGDDNYASIGVYVGTNSNNIINVEPVDGGYVMKYNYVGRSWPARQYLYPIPEVVIQFNPNLKQNPGWS